MLAVLISWVNFCTKFPSIRTENKSFSATVNDPASINGVQKALSTTGDLRVSSLIFTLGVEVILSKKSATHS